MIMEDPCKLQARVKEVDTNLSISAASDRTVAAAPLYNASKKAVHDPWLMTQTQ